ncbi:MAG: response regulator MprA [Patescibacteria group bacterium]|nr:response regulator MprA [Patescibacteria group bacterium]
MKHGIKKAFLAGILVVCILVASYAVFHKTNKSTNEYLPIDESLSTPGGTIHVRVADTDAERELGLSYFKKLPTDQGMLFVFDKPGIYPFWMKGMKFPLDMVWLKKAPDSTFAPGHFYEVVSITRNATPGSYPEGTFQSDAPADAVLEINANTAYRFGLVAGERIQIIPFITGRGPVLNP